jgi:hypothetical protein
MKTLFSLVLLLVLTSGSLGYFEYQQHLQIIALQTQTSILTSEVNAQRTALISHKKAIVHIQSQNQAVEKLVLKIIDFLNEIEVIPETHEKPGASS